MILSQRLAALSESILPVWVYDHERQCFLWANAAALVVWRADSLEEFLSRDLSDLSDSTRTRLDITWTLYARGAGGRDWTLYRAASRLP